MSSQNPNPKGKGKGKGKKDGSQPSIKVSMASASNKRAMAEHFAKKAEEYHRMAKEEEKKKEEGKEEERKKKREEKKKPDPLNPLNIMFAGMGTGSSGNDASSPKPKEDWEKEAEEILADGKGTTGANDTGASGDDDEDDSFTVVGTSISN